MANPAEVTSIQAQIPIDMEMDRIVILIVPIDSNVSVSVGNLEIKVCAHPNVTTTVTTLPTTTSSVTTVGTTTSTTTTSTSTPSTTSVPTSTTTFLTTVPVCAYNEQTFDYSNQEGINVTDTEGNDASDLLRGSTAGSFSSTSGPNLVITFTETQPGENTLMDISEFEATNAAIVKMTVTTSDGDSYTSTVNMTL